jgi:ATP-binding cassette, subfamily B, multidrug efflux pump
MEDPRALKGDIRKLLRFVKPYRSLALFAFVMLLGMVAFDLAVPRLIERIIDEGIKAKNMGVVLRTAVLMLFVSASSALVAVLNSNSSVRVGESVARDLREALFVGIEGFSYGNLDEFSTGTLMVRLTSDSSAVQRLVQVSLRIGTRAPLTMIGSIILMFVTSPRLATLMIPLLFVAGAAIVFFSVKMEPLFRDVQRKLDRLNTVLQENISGARLVKSFVRAGRETERFDAANEDLNQRTIRVQEFMSSMTPILTLLINIGMVLVVYFGGFDAVRGKLSLGQIVAFTNYLLATLQPLTMMTQLSNTWANGLASLKRIDEVIDTEPEVKESPNALPAPDSADVSFDRVSFRYRGEAKVSVLDSVSFQAEQGVMVAILGATGSGKSSLVNLIPRFYDVTGGAVRIGGRDVRDMKEASLLGLVAIVPQESILFSGTVRDNIRYGKPGASEEEVVAAARTAQAHEFILALPQGYDTHIEERGGNLSGGQKQRIAIARAAIMKPDILIMDDSTSAVDVETETKIQASLKEFLVGSTCFVVAQRISTVLNADKILVLDEGRVVAEGKHAELLESSPIYREIYDSQLGGGVHAD